VRSHARSVFCTRREGPTVQFDDDRLPVLGGLQERAPLVREGRRARALDELDHHVPHGVDDWGEIWESSQRRAAAMPSAGAAMVPIRIPTRHASYQHRPGWKAV
jgi:hypothetical protein